MPIDDQADTDHPEPLTAHFPENLAGQRIDAALAQVFPEYSRSQLTQWLKAGALQINGQQPRPRDKVMGHESITLTLPEPPCAHAQAEAIALDIPYADNSVLIINKPAGLVVHPAAGHRQGTLVNALLYHVPELAQLPRAGIVHRLDKDTTGLLVVARTPAAQTHLVRQLQARSMHREYLALVHGHLISGGSIDAPIGRHPVDRQRMAVVSGGKPAVTHYRIARRFARYTLLKVQLETGRTHQIRVHMAHLGHPVVGDPTYSGRHAGHQAAWTGALSQPWQRQALHAAALGLTHPATETELQFTAPLPTDFAELLAVLGQ